MAATIQFEPIELASLGVGAMKVIGGNITDTWRGTIFTATGSTVAYVKMLPQNQLISEAVCALLGRALNLNMPKPFLVHVTKDSLRKSTKWGVKERERICFGSEDARHPSLKRLIDNSKKIPAMAAKFVELWLDWAGLMETTIFDEWIANRDRHIGNILYDGREFYLIDHSHALTGQRWKLSDLKPDADVPNFWLDKLCPRLSHADKVAWKDKAGFERLKYQCLEFSTLVEKAELTKFSLPTEAQAVATFIEKRADLIFRLICQRLNLGLLPI